MKILIVEDNKNIRRELKELIEKYGYEVSLLESFSNPVKDILTAAPHLVLLDINLPEYDGFYICRELRTKSNIPIIMVTSRDSEMDELMSMNLGADDFITKPYNTQILLAHIASVLKRTYNQEYSEKITDGLLSLNLSQSKAANQNKEIELSKNELRILCELMKRKGTIISRDHLMDVLWQSDEFIDDNTLTVNINRLRKKLDEIGVRDYIKTKRGQGYIV